MQEPAHILCGKTYRFWRIHILGHSTWRWPVLALKRCMPKKMQIRRSASQPHVPSSVGPLTHQLLLKSLLQIPCKVRVKAHSLQYGDTLNHQKIAFEPLRFWRVKQAALFHLAEFLQCLHYPKASLRTSAVHEMADHPRQIQPEII